MSERDIERNIIMSSMFGCAGIAILVKLAFWGMVVYALYLLITGGLS